MPNAGRALVDDLNGDPHQQAVLRATYEQLHAQTLWPWVTARWGNATVTGLVRRDESGHAYMFAEGVWHLDRLGATCVRPDRLERAQPSYHPLATTTPSGRLTVTVAAAIAAAKEHAADPDTPEPHCSATYVNRETRLIVEHGRVRWQSNVLLFRAGHRWLELSSKLGALSPKLTHLQLHPTLKATR